MDIQQIKKLAQLARLDVPEVELATVAGEMEAILGFVDEIQAVHIDQEKTETTEINMFRDDAARPIVPNHDLVEAAALHQDHFVKVPKVIGD